MNRNLARLLRVSAAVVVAAGALSACAPLLFGGAIVGGSMIATDRRTTGTQLEDEVIDVKATNRARDAIGGRGRVNVTSYNRMLLITGQVPTEADKAAVERAAAGTENVESVINELTLAPPLSVGGRSSDVLIASKIKASFIDAKDLFSQSIKVVVDSGTVYLMGRVTEREADRAANIARGVSGVRKVVKVFRIVSEAELAGTLPTPPPPVKP